MQKLLFLLPLLFFSSFLTAQQTDALKNKGTESSLSRRPTNRHQKKRLNPLYSNKGIYLTFFFVFTVCFFWHKYVLEKTNRLKKKEDRLKQEKQAILDEFV